MMDLKSFMERWNVSKKEYVDNWIDKDLIPGAERDSEKTEYQFPDSARRPYQDRWLKPGITADRVWAHIVKAAIKRQYISDSICFASSSEFQSIIDKLVKAELIELRYDEGVMYIDATLKSLEYKNRSMKDLRKFVLEAIEAVAKGTTSAILDHATGNAAA